MPPCCSNPSQATGACGAGKPGGMGVHGAQVLRYVQDGGHGNRATARRVQPCMQRLVFYCACCWCLSLACACLHVLPCVHCSRSCLARVFPWGCGPPCRHAATDLVSCVQAQHVAHHHLRVVDQHLRGVPDHLDLDGVTLRVQFPELLVFLEVVSSSCRSQSTHTQQPSVRPGASGLADRCTQRALLGLVWGHMLGSTTMRAGCSGQHVLKPTPGYTG